MKEQYPNQNISSLPCQQKLGSPHRRFKPWRNWSINSPNPTTTPWNCSSNTWGGKSPSIHTTKYWVPHRTFWGPLNHLGGWWEDNNNNISVNFSYLSFIGICELQRFSQTSVVWNLALSSLMINKKDLVFENMWACIWALIRRLLFYVRLSTLWNWTELTFSWLSS